LANMSGEYAAVVLSGDLLTPASHTHKGA
jgi:hypothetical protein